jgi:hypothetical protein
MELNYQCSICGRQTGRKENATRHLRLIHDGNGEVIDITGRSRAVRTPAMPSKHQKLLKWIQMLDGEEYIREAARLRARGDYKLLGSNSIYMDDYILIAIKHIESALSSDSISVSKLIEELTGFDVINIQSEKRKKAILERPLLELIKDKHGSR